MIALSLILIVLVIQTASHQLEKLKGYSENKLEFIEVKLKTLQLFCLVTKSNSVHIVDLLIGAPTG